MDTCKLCGYCDSTLSNQCLNQWQECKHCWYTGHEDNFVQNGVCDMCDKLYAFCGTCKEKKYVGRHMESFHTILAIGWKCKECKLLN